jgi:uncharacterized protein (AIM24 family)
LEIASMARFEIVAEEGLKMVRCTIAGETVRAESGALHYMRGKIEMVSSAPSVGGFFKSVMTGENIFRPTYTGTGEIFFGPPIFGEYEILNLAGEEWILEQGSYVASDAGIELSAFRNKAVTALVGGEGWFQTSVKGTGQVVIQAPGKIERIELAGDRLSVDGKFAIARSAGLQYEVQRAARSILGSLTSGEGVLSIFEGTGTVLIAPVPNLYQNLVSMIEGKLPKGK